MTPSAFIHLPSQRLAGKERRFLPGMNDRGFRAESSVKDLVL